ncbi:MAG: SRPBCC family protein [Balneolaceae bacterium]|nr:SRPBCC family protein [Balneolaceae bacterium]
MQKVEVSGTIQALPQEVWKIVKNFGELDQFVEAIAECTVNQSGKRPVRTLILADGGEVTEQLLNLDDRDYELTYSILESPMPIDNYTGTMKLEASGDQQTEFTWSSTFEVPEEHADEIREALEGLYQLGLEGLKKKFAE